MLLLAHSFFPPSVGVAALRPAVLLCGSPFATGRDFAIPMRHLPRLPIEVLESRAAPIVAGLVWSENYYVFPYVCPITTFHLTMQVIASSHLYACMHLYVCITSLASTDP